MPTFQITDCFGEQVTLQPRLGLYSVTDFGGQEMPGLAIILDRLGSTPEETEQYAVLTTSFGEFIGAKDCAYIDTNNCYFAPQLLEQGFAENTGLTKSSGFCQYPLWHFKEDFLREIGGEVYEQYANCFQSYMHTGPFGGPEPAEEPTNQMGGMKMK